MTASAHGRRSTRQALWSAASALTPWSVRMPVLLAVLALLLLPSATSAAAGAAARSGSVAPTASAALPTHHAGTVTPASTRPEALTPRSGVAPEDRGAAMLCSATGPGDGQGSGCDTHRHCLQDAVLPNSPPLPLMAAPPTMVAPHPAPVADLQGTLPGSQRPPDVHLLQVLRT